VASGRAIESLAAENTRQSRLQGGFDWLSSRYAGFIGNPASSYYYYGLASFAKACVLGHVNRFGSQTPWYESLSAKLATLQNADGSWSDGEAHKSTVFALMALQTGQLPPGIDRTIRIILSQGGSSASLALSETCIPDLHVYDQQGRHTGRNPFTGEIETLIPGSTFEIIGTEQIFTLPDPDPSTYHIEITSSCNGTYDLRVEGLEDGEITSDADFSDLQIVTGETQTTDLTVTSIVGSMSIYVNPPGSGAVLEVSPTEINRTGVAPGKTDLFTITVSERGGIQDVFGVTLQATSLVGPGGATIEPEAFTFTPNGFTLVSGGTQQVQTAK